MAKMIGTTKSWIWWLGGLLCALAFGAQARAAEAVALYGIRPRPGPLPPAKQPTVTDEEKAEAAKLVEKYFQAPDAVEPQGAEKEKIDKLVAQFGSDDFGLREGASRDVVKFGAKALPALGVAAESTDAEVAQRARVAITVIEKELRSGTVKDMQRVRAAAMIVIQEQQQAQQALLYKVKLEILALQKEKDNEEKLEAKRAEARVAQDKVNELRALYNLIAYGGAQIRPVAKYGIRPRPMPMPMPPIKMQVDEEKK